MDLATILIGLGLFGIGLTQLLVGGAFATVLIGIAAQQSLSNLFAGMVLVLARPMQVGTGCRSDQGRSAASSSGK
jgi:small-conductance mechanosensitive channel